MADSDLILSHDGSVSTLTINNPTRRNALTYEMWMALPGLISEAEAREDTRIVVLRGHGPETFSAGADISEFETLRSNARDAEHYEQSNIDAFKALRTCRHPTLALIRGHCLGGGFGLAAACDLRFAAPDTRFGIPAARLGLAYPPSAIKDIVALIGPSETKALFFSARPITTDKAHAIGFITEIVDDKDLDHTVRETAHQITANAPLTLSAAKAAIDAVLPGADQDAALRAGQMAKVCFDSQDFAEGRTAFLEKRPAKFKGR